MRRAFPRLLPVAAVVFTAALAYSPRAWAQAKTEGESSKEAAISRESELARPKELPTLEQRIRPVSGRMFGKRGRFEIGVGAQLSFADAFFSKYFGSLTLDYHLAEMVAIGLRVSGGLAVVSGAAVKCQGGTCSAPQDADMKTAVGRIPLLASIGVSVAPVYGKLNLMAEKVVHFDLYATVGATMAFNTVGTSSGVGPGAVIAVGQRYFLNRFISLRLEVADYLYVAGPQDEAKLQQQLMFALGVTFFLPTEFEAQ